MNIARYSIAAGASLALHVALLFVAHEPKVFAMPAGSQSTSVSLSFTAAPAKVQPQATPPDTPPDTSVPDALQNNVPQPDTKVSPPKLEPVEKVVVEKKVTLKKKKTPVPKIEKNTQKVVKTQASENRPVDKPRTEQHKKKNESPSKNQNTASQVKELSPESKTKANSGATAQPVIVNKPSFLSKPTPPKYPRLARKRGIEGIAMYEVWLDADGKQIRQVLISSSGATMLDKSALNAIKQWQFSPQLVDGQKIAHRVQIPVRFKLDR